MQFQLTTRVFGINKVQVERETYCSAFTGQDPADPSVTRGFEITKLSADPVVFDQLLKLKAGDEVTFLAILKRAAGGKSQPYLVGVVPESKGSSASGSAAK